MTSTGKEEEEEEGKTRRSTAYRVNHEQVGIDFSVVVVVVVVINVREVSKSQNTPRDDRIKPC